MSAKSIQTKLNNAHKKIGKKIGYVYGLYRPLYSNIDVISDQNLIKYVNATVTLNDSYNSNIKWEVPIWTVYTETAELQMGDYLYSEETGRTFFVLNKQDHQPVLVIEANDRIDIKQVTYGDNGNGFAPGNMTYLAQRLPCYLSYGSSTIGSNLPGNGVSGIPIRTMEVYTALPKTTMLLGETLLDADGFKGDVTSYDYSSVGIGVRITVAERGFPNAS